MTSSDDDNVVAVSADDDDDAATEDADDGDGNACQLRGDTEPMEGYNVSICSEDDRASSVNHNKTCATGGVKTMAAKVMDERPPSSTSTQEDPENVSSAFWVREERVLTRLSMATAGIPYAVVMVAAIISLGVAVGRQGDLRHIEGHLEVICACDAIVNEVLQEARETILSILCRNRNFTASRQPKIQDLFARISGSSFDMTSIQQQMDATRQKYSSLQQQQKTNQNAAIRETLCEYRKATASIATACPKVGENTASWLESRIGSDLRQLDKIVQLRLGEIQYGVSSLLMSLYLECSGNLDDCPTVEENLNMKTKIKAEPGDENGSECLKDERVEMEDVRSGLRDLRSTNNIRIGLFAAILVLLLIGYPLSCVVGAKLIHQFTSELQQLREKYRSQTESMEADVKQTEVLLCRLLPKSIVDDLKTEKSVLAECYQLVTIYVSDIVGFTNIAASSTPMQVVEFLNGLYTEFDSRIDLYDVYKVETIGDAYVIVSGCPRTNGLRHAGELATLALDLLHMTADFVIPHKPHGKLMLRIGLHSGPCVAAVVGLQMPRYCLLGDTVNIASRMESTGQALRIQVSEDCKEILDGLGDYEFEDRGQVEVKKNVFIRTYWLTGKDGYRFSEEKDVCLYIPKKVKLERVVVRKIKAKPDASQQPLEDQP